MCASQNNYNTINGKFSHLTQFMFHRSGIPIEKALPLFFVQSLSVVLKTPKWGERYSSGCQYTDQEPQCNLVVKD